MKSPFTEGEVLLKHEKRTHTYRNQEFTINAQYYQCVDTGETFTTDEIDSLNLTQLHNLYREQNRILFPEQIKAIREKYGVSQRTMSMIMGFGVNQYRSYEDGEVPSLSNARLIELAQKPENFHKLVLDKKSELKDRDFAEITQRIDELCKPKFTDCSSFLSTWQQEELPNHYTGYKLPDFEKFAQMVVFFYHRAKPLFTTKLNKLLFYADFLHYSRFGTSMSGLTYCAIDMGPVPDSYRTLNDMLVREGYLETYIYPLSNGELVDAFRPAVHLEESYFSSRELDVLNQIVEHFKTKSTQEVITISHQEPAWKDNNGQKARIDYQKYAFQLIAFTH